MYLLRSELLTKTGLLIGAIKLVGFFLLKEKKNMDI